MKSIAIAGALLAAPALAEQDNFAVWSKKHGKKYATKEEMVLRRSIFAANLAKINKHNAEGHSWTMGVNKFADLTADEFKAMYAGGLGPVGSAMPKAEKMVMPKNLSANPTSVDWDAKGAVTPVKNQGQCGSCWAFSTTGSVESATFLKTGTLPSLSEQQLVDCSGSQGNEGCNGGWYYWAYQYIIDNKGITTETAYPYTAVDGTCAATGKPVGATLTSFKEVPASSETALETAIVQQPISVAVEADQDVFQFYTSGVMDSACGTNIDHAILAVGYGTDAGKDYYKVKNSWGADWGMKGYILLGRGAKFNPSGQCGVQLYPYYPIA